MARLPAGGRDKPPAKSTRLRNPFKYEKGLWGRGLHLVAGIDEVGRGPLAGPVVAAAVILRPGRPIRGAADSKTLSARQRDALVGEIRKRAVGIGIGAASTREI